MLALFLRSLRNEQYAVRYKLLRAREAARSARKVVELSLPGFDNPISLRPRGSDYYTFHQVFTDKHYEHQLSFEPSFIIDAGANVGFSAIYFARQYPEAQIFAIEPDATNFELLYENTRYYPNVQCFNAALWPIETPLAITNPNDSNPAAYNVRPSTSFPGIRSLTPLKLLEIAGPSQIDIFKIDIEGAELELFSDADADAWLDRTRVIMIELHDSVRPGCGEAFFRSVSRRGFTYAQRAETSIVEFGSRKSLEVLDIAASTKRPVR